MVANTANDIATTVAQRIWSDPKCRLLILAGGRAEFTLTRAYGGFMTKSKNDEATEFLIWPIETF